MKKIIVIALKKDILPAIFIICIIFFLLVSIGWEKTLTVLNNAAGNPIYSGDKSKNMVAFECNVVWGTEYVPQMLDIFKKENIHITFFIGGKWAKDNPDILKRIAKEGHELGNHGYNHLHHSKLSLEKNLREIKDTESVIKKITGVKTSLFAPPYGEFNKTTLNAAKSLGYKTIMWSVDTIDWKREGADKIIQRVLKNVHSGAFILMHPTRDTVEALPTIIEQLTKKGYKIGKISDLLD